MRVQSNETLKELAVTCLANNKQQQQQQQQQQQKTEIEAFLVILFAIFVMTCLLHYFYFHLPRRLILPKRTSRYELEIACGRSKQTPFLVDLTCFPKRCNTSSTVILVPKPLGGR